MSAVFAWISGTTSQPGPWSVAYRFVESDSLANVCGAYAYLCRPWHAPKRRQLGGAESRRRGAAATAAKGCYGGGAAHRFYVAFTGNSIFMGMSGWRLGIGRNKAADFQTLDRCKMHPYGGECQRIWIPKRIHFPVDIIALLRVISVRGWMGNLWHDIPRMNPRTRTLCIKSLNNNSFIPFASTRNPALMNNSLANPTFSTQLQFLKRKKRNW